MSNYTLAAFLEDARHFRTIPIVRRFLADVFEPLKIFENLREDAVFLLESKDDQSPWARYSFIGLSPFLTLESKNGHTFSVIDERGEEIANTSSLKEAFCFIEQKLCVKRLNEALPFTGGAVGFLGYDFISAIEKVPIHPNQDLSMKIGYFTFCESLIVLDHHKRELVFIHYVRLTEQDTEETKKKKYEQGLKQIAALMKKAASGREERLLLLDRADEEAGVSFQGVISNYDKARFLQDVETIKRYIASGDVFQAVLSQRFAVPVRVSGFQVYRMLRHINPSPYMFYFCLDNFEIVGSSPEKLIQVYNRHMEIHPIAGTRRRGRSTEEDERLFAMTEGMDVIVIVNKTDLPQNIDIERVKELAAGRPIVATSLLCERGIDELEKAIADLFFGGELEAGDLTYVSNSRHIALLEQAKKAIEDALSGIDVGMPVDLVQIDLRRAWELLGEIVGDTVHESLIDQLFAQFCLGK